MADEKVGQGKNAVKYTHFVQSFIALITKILAAASVLILNAVITRVLSLSEAGSYLTLNAFILFWVMAAASGIPQILMRWVALKKATDDYHDMERNVLQGVLLLLLLGGLSAYGLLLAWHDRILGDSAKNLGVMMVIIWICLGLVLRVFGEVYRGLGSAGIANLVTAVNSHGILVTLIVAAIIALLHYLKYAMDLSLIAETYIVVLVIAVACIGVKLISEIRQLRSRSIPTTPHHKEELFSMSMLKNGLMLSIAELSIYIMTQGDIWIVGKYASATEVALYGIAAKTAFLASLPLIAINSVLPARIAAYIHEGKTETLQAEIKRLMTVSFIAVLAWLVICQFAGGQLLALAFGKQYESAKYFLVILSLGHVINVATGPGGLLLIMYHRERDLVCGTLLVLAIYLACVFPMGRLYGAMGVAYCSAAGFMLVKVVYVILVKRATGINSGVIAFS